ncbi:MAG: YbaK/EbsC family protein [Proteobacteria bacterium]|nr:YbaK/EbsC family protein [Pseudomonadota bacterium]MYJ96304.1 YbaK/EbsC family protein [Pseudomonadota bacterium]
MSIATTVGDALAFEEIDFRILRHRSRHSPAQAAERAGIPPQQLARAVLLKDPYGYVLTVMPAHCEPDLELLRATLHRQLTVATDHDLDDLFCDCAVGSVPPIGPWYRVPTVVDITLRAQPDVYFEAGDHRSLVQVSDTNFKRLMQGAEYFAFSNPADN